jgi:hypothetical protein
VNITWDFLAEIKLSRKSVILKKFPLWHCFLELHLGQGAFG